jgi:hypothetical protein
MLGLDEGRQRGAGSMALPQRARSGSGLLIELRRQARLLDYPWVVARDESGPRYGPTDVGTLSLGTALVPTALSYASRASTDVDAWDAGDA